jgi:hypothetical protein
VECRGTSGEIITFITPPSAWIRHSNASIDLCVCAVWPILERYGYDPGTVPGLDFACVHSHNIPDNGTIEDDCDALEPVLLFGYPENIYDRMHLLPIARRGMTATVPWVDFDNAPQFLIDIAGYQGDSGGPVFVVDQGFRVKDDSFVPSRRLYLLGIFSDVWEASRNVHGPKGDINETWSRVPMGLGVCTKAFALLDLIDVAYRR